MGMSRFIFIFERVCLHNDIMSLARIETLKSLVVIEKPVLVKIAPPLYSLLFDMINLSDRK